MWDRLPSAALLTVWDECWGDTFVANEGDATAVGVVRLDNRRDVERWAGAEGESLSDLQVLLRAVTRCGEKVIPLVLGDFAFALWWDSQPTVIAATDALGVRKLYYTVRDGVLVFGSRAEALVRGEDYEPQYLCELMANATMTPGLTAYRGVSRLPAGSIMRCVGETVSVDPFWSPAEFSDDLAFGNAEREAPEILRTLLADSLRKRVTNDGKTWSQLSGGLDSSSLVCLTQMLAAKGEIAGGLAGTVTFVDAQGTDADEREYANTVIAHWPVPNVAIVDPPLWVDAHYPPPFLDQPIDSLAFHPRERRLCNIVRRAGARVLLAGYGSDELFTGSTIFLADCVARGRVGLTARELTRWAIAGRLSFWQLAWYNALIPLIPAACYRPKAVDRGRILPWIAPAAVERYGLRGRSFSSAGNAGRWGRKYHDALAASVTAMATKLDAGAIGDTLDVRYPFLSRPLVEFALRLAPTLCARPHARKWVLREAMRGILPERIRTRVGKGSPHVVLAKSLVRQRALLMCLLRDSLLADLGLIDIGQLRAAFERAPFDMWGERDISADVQQTLMVEAWLRIRSGRWPQGPSNKV